VCCIVSPALLQLGEAFRKKGEECLRAHGGQMDYKKEWEALDREMLKKYDSVASFQSCGGAVLSLLLSMMLLTWCV
jgi:hypothetical protein